MINRGALVTDTSHSLVSHLTLKRLHWNHDKLLSLTIQSMTHSLITADSPVDALRVAGVPCAGQLHGEPKGPRT